MHELPTITEIGKATEVILGIAASGADMDGSWLPGGYEFADDHEASAVLVVEK
jgi:hypothetical protein